jgi:hypothetical protein
MLSGWLSMTSIAAAQMTASHPLPRPPTAHRQGSISYQRPLRDLDDLAGFRLEQAGQWLALQDLQEGVLLLVDPVTIKIEHRWSFPAEVLALSFHASGQVFGLTAGKILVFPDLASLKQCFVASPSPAKPPREILLQEPSLEPDRPRYLFHVDPEGYFLIWDREDSTLHVLRPDGSLAMSAPCQSHFVPLKRQRFLTAFYGPDDGSRVLEISYSQAVTAEGAQADLPLMAIEADLPDRNEVRLIGLEPRDGSPLVIIYPPSAVDPSSSRSPSFPITTLSQPRTDLASDPRFAWFTDPSDPSALLVVLAKMDRQGKITPISTFPQADADGKAIVGSTGVTWLAPKVDPATFHLEGFDLWFCPCP